MTLNGRTARYCTNDASFGAHCGNLKEDRRILSAAKYIPTTLLSDGASFCGYTWGFRGEEASTDNWVIRTYDY